MTLEEYDILHHNLKNCALLQIGDYQTWTVTCWCGWTTQPYLSNDSARRAHDRHQYVELGRAAMEREHR